MYLDLNTIESNVISLMELKRRLKIQKALTSMNYKQLGFQLNSGGRYQKRSETLIKKKRVNVRSGALI